MSAENILVAGCLFVLILAIGQLFVKRKQTTNKILFLLFIVCFCWISHGIGYHLSWISDVPHLNKVHVPFVCATGPLWYFYIRSLHNDEVEKISWHRASIFVVCTIVLSIPFYLQGATYKQAYIETEIVDFAAASMYTGTRVAELTVIYYCVRTLLYLGDYVKIRTLFSDAQTSGFLWLFALSALLAATMRLTGSVLGNHNVSVVIPCFIAILLSVALYILSYRRPVVLSLSQHAGRHIKTTSLTDRHLLQQYKKRIQAEKWFLEPNVKILFVARKLGVPANRLSELINSAAGINFNEFINQFRIEHAKGLLLRKPNNSILDIAYESGFNSKSAFYKQFTTVTGTTPAQFRRDNCVEKI